ncbi:tRNA (adenine(22)-N(1))-methyltransferase [Paenibacillus turpanensis]|uniref:tRNA (adenine(22)-N(1))-methyltransferase n=1 Tax=Paenibacillus turpanensis TaxID=2689078 RepID=UPI001FB7DFAD|nr:class I SAM-dependent methyltransferase [Paenibacillus turpanensis]
MIVKLSKRLQTIAELVLPGSKTADIGSDHALLPVYLVQLNKIPLAIAGEINEGPYDAAVRGVAEADLSKQITVRRGDGLSVLIPGEVDAVTIAGMGGALISHILESGKEKLAGVRQLVLQPNVGETFVRQWLRANDWYLQSETILEEDGKIYEVLNSVRAPDAHQRNAELYCVESEAGLQIHEEMKLTFGPYLLFQENSVFEQKWNGELAKLQMIAKQMKESDSEQSKRKLQQFEEEMKQITEVLAWRQKARRSSK